MYDRKYLKEVSNNAFSISHVYFQIPFLPKYKQKASTYFSFYFTLNQREIDIFYYPFAKNFKVLSFFKDSRDSSDETNDIFRNYVDGRINPLNFYKFFGTSAIKFLSDYFKNNFDLLFPTSTNNFAFWKAAYRFQESLQSTIKDLDLSVFINKEDNL